MASVESIGGAVDVVMKSDAGIDIDIRETDGVESVCISAIPGGAEAAPETERGRKIVIEGDQCVSVMSIPYVKVENGTQVESEDHGIVVLGSTCKPCCQCDDYMAAANALSSVSTGVGAVNAVVDAIWDDYVAAVDAYNAEIDAIRGSLDTYDNVVVQAARMGGSDVGTMYFTASITVLNMTTVGLAVSAGMVGSAVKGQAWSASAVKSGPSSGQSAPSGVKLGPGGSLAYSAILVSPKAGYAAGCRYSVSLRLDGKSEKTVSGVV